MSWRNSIIVIVLCSVAALYASCRQTGGGDGDGDGDADGDGDGDGDADADGDFDAAICENPFPLGGECEPFNQWCCEAGERCAIVAPDIAPDSPVESCVSSSGGGSHGSPCADGLDEACGGGTYCLPHTMVTFCSRLCLNSGDCPDEPEHTCVPIETTSSAYNVCIPAFAECNPLLEVGCPDGWACVMELFPSTVLTSCHPEGVHSVGGDCSDGGGCVMGSGCYQVSEGVSQCLEYCELTEGCALGGECIDIHPNPTMDHPFYGVCLSE